MMGFGMGFGLFGLVLMALFVLVPIVLVVWGVRAMAASGGAGVAGREDAGPTPRQILDQRYARGEISREDYELMKQDLG